MDKRIKKLLGEDNQNEPKTIKFESSSLKLGEQIMINKKYFKVTNIKPNSKTLNSLPMVTLEEMVDGGL